MKPQIILELEKELDCTFKIVDLSKIEERKDEKTTEYSINEAGHIKGIGIQKFHLEEIPKAIINNSSDLLFLESLNLAYNQIYNINYLETFDHIISLNLSWCKIKRIGALKRCINLTKIDLAHNEIEDIGCFKYLTKLNICDLNANSIYDIMPLSMCDKMIKLSIEGNYLTNIETLEKLINLERLSLRDNEITDISSIRNFKKLTQLYLGFNSISDISSISTLTTLKELGISNNQITDISSLNNLKSLEELYAMNNSIEKIEVLRSLNNLTIIGLAGNKISEISSILKLKKLRKVVLCNNPIRKVPKDITQLNLEIQLKDVLIGGDGFISFFNNDLNTPPNEIVKQGKAAIKKYFEELIKEQQQYNFEVKLMLIGEGGTGKTSVLRKLLDKNSLLPDAADTTLGIDIQKWNFPLNKKLFGHLPALKQDNMLVNIWDFGGQKIYHGTYQIFFGVDAFYILVEETRELKTDFSYWFNTIEQLAGEKANLLVVINEKFGYVKRFDSEGYKTKFGFVNQLIHLDLSKIDDKIIKLQELVKTAIQFLPNIGMPLPASYIRIKEDLFKLKEDFISLDEFRKICNNQGISDFDSVKVLSKYLHETGAITHFIDDNVLQNRVFLNSEWLVKTLYKVLDEQTIKDKKGRITKEEVCNIWRSENLDFEINSLTQLMHKFGLMYKVRDKDEYVIPAHLPTEKPYPIWKHQHPIQTLIFKYEFGKYMPEGLMSHLIVSLRSYFENEVNVWHRGVNLRYEKTFAEIIETYGEINTFEIKISGMQKREMLAIIRHHFLEVIKPFKKLYYKELIPCNCEKCFGSLNPFFYSYENLLKRLEKNKPANCDESLEDIDVRKLIDNTILDEKENKILIEETKQQQETLGKKITLEIDLVSHLSSNDHVVQILDSLSNEVKEIRIENNQSKTEILQGQKDIKDEIIKAITELTVAQLQAIWTDIAAFFFEFENVMNEKLLDHLKQIKSASSLQSKLELSLPFIKMLGVDYKIEFDVVGWAKKMYAKHELEIFKLMGLI